jgi:hypothetical protein
MVCNANSIQTLFTDDDTLDEHKFRNQEKQILFVVSTSTQLPHCATRISTKLLFYFIA